MAGFDSKEYTRLRDIAHKRMTRGVEQGLISEIHFPTVREIKAGIVDPRMALAEIKSYLASGSTVTAIKQTGLLPVFREFPRLPERMPISSDERRMRKRASDKAYRIRKKLRETFNKTTGENYLKALESLQRKHRKKGRNFADNLLKMTPTEAAAFVAYMDYRFAQGDFTQLYVIDEFIADFSKLRKQGYSAQEIIKDFDIFLSHQAEVKDRADNMEGLTANQTLGLWRKFVGG